MSAAIDSEVGIGVPSKYLDLPVLSFGRAETVTLKRASRVRPHSTKKVSRIWSAGVRRPRAKAAAAGDAPKDSWVVGVSGLGSSSWVCGSWW